MKALTLWQPWASFVALGLKTYEFRRWRPPGAIIGERIVIHAAKRPVDVDEVRALLADRARLWASLGAPEIAQENMVRFILKYVLLGDRPHLGAGLAEATLGAPVRAPDLFGGRMHPDDIDPDMWAWPMLDVQAFPEPIPARGAQGFWNWKPEAAGR